MKKKLCILQNGLKYGGTDTFVLNLINNLPKSKYEIILVVSGKEEDIMRISDFEKNSKIYRTCALDSMRNILKHLSILFKILKKEKIDIFQTNIDLFNGVNLFIAWLAGVKIRICHSHNSLQAKEVENKNMLLLVYQIFMKNLCWLFSNRRTGCSQAAMNFLYGRKWEHDKNSMVTYNGIDLERFNIQIDREEKKKELNLNATKNILVVGRIDIQKNPKFIIEVFYKITKQDNDCNLVWVGTGDMEAEIKNLSKLYNIQDRIHFLGKRSDVNEIMKCCDLLFMPSNFEGFGIVLIEAQSAGLSCVVSKNVPSETNCGGCHYLDLDIPTEKWVDCILKQIYNNSDEIEKNY